MTDWLDAETAYCDEIRPQLLERHAGKFILIRNRQFCGAFDTPQNAYRAGVARFQDDKFLVKEIRVTERSEISPAIALGLLRAHS